MTSSADGSRRMIFASARVSSTLADQVKRPLNRNRVSGITFPFQRTDTLRAAASQRKPEFPEYPVRRPAAVQRVAAEVEQGAVLLNGHRPSPEFLRFLQHDDRLPRPGEIAGRYQPGNAAADDNDFRLCHSNHPPSFVLPL